MSKLRLLLCPTLFFVWACATAPKAQTPAPAPVLTATAPAAAAPATPPAPVSWKTKLVDLGAVKKGEKRSLQFEFTNTFGEDIKIYSVDACECTKVEFPRGIIPMGEKRVLDVVFDSESKEASETLSIYVYFEKPGKPDETPMIELVQYHFDLEK